MNSRRWALWLSTLGAGAGIALGAGHGVAAADTETSAGAGAGAGTSSQSESDDKRSVTDTSDTSGPSGTTDTSGTSGTPDTSATSDASDSPDPVEADPVDADPVEADPVEADPVEADPVDADPVEAEPASVTERAGARHSDAAEPELTEAEVAQAEVAEAAITEPEAPRPEVTPAVQAAAVTGVKTGRAALTIPVGRNGYTTRADWYLPTQADGSVAATGVIWLQHGFLGNKAALSRLAQTLSQQTNSIVVAPNLSSFPLACSGCWINGVPMQEAVASMFLGDRASLTTSANTAGFLGSLPEEFVLSGQSGGGGFATAVGGYYSDDPANNGSLRGVVMFDGYAYNGVIPGALAKIDDPFIPVYQVAAPPQPWNGNGSTTRELVAARPDRFVGVTLARGSHADALIGGNALFDFFAQLVAGVSPRGNTEAAYTLATGWINDMYLGLGPVDGSGIYGVPGQYIVLGDAAAVVLAPAPVVDLNRYLGTWYEVGSVKQFFSIGLVNTKAVYSFNPNGSVRVENSGNYFVDNGPKSSIVGAALPVNAANNRLNVRFVGAPSARPPGNYWIVDLDDDYQWAVVTDSTGGSGFLLSRTAVVSADFYQELLDRASVNGVKGRITPTRQPAQARRRRARSTT
ncbi:lipocalin family protein [Mycolicibacterium vaccae]|uniref:Lipocalin family protein n=1 Tax=Mycolicibacterium vaccae ATCC 25954 TaxID=1194972 RepID=K0VEK3_MYCVA|nr:lipocalin family protein [Mycolicibacterium vaccae]ANI37704.1 lipocalin [Mycolicibacterium vaccae 95051]EJZ09474.1 Lipocalin family protein [Mycolicibacterium vaccae ATCC 25954]